VSDIYHGYATETALEKFMCRNHSHCWQRRADTEF